MQLPDGLAELFRDIRQRLARALATGERLLAALPGGSKVKGLLRPARRFLNDDD